MLMHNRKQNFSVLFETYIFKPFNILYLQSRVNL